MGDTAESLATDSFSPGIHPGGRTWSAALSEATAPTFSKFGHELFICLLEYFREPVLVHLPLPAVAAQSWPPWRSWVCGVSLALSKVTHGPSKAQRHSHPVVLPGCHPLHLSWGRLVLRLSPHCSCPLRVVGTVTCPLGKHSLLWLIIRNPILFKVAPRPVKISAFLKTFAAWGSWVPWFSVWEFCQEFLEIRCFCDCNITLSSFSWSSPTWNMHMRLN
jgi:hypothetical protein